MYRYVVVYNIYWLEFILVVSIWFLYMKYVVRNILYELIF